ncbi:MULTISPECIES: ABC transporter permease [unclassified Achromobacter]|uniref:ABC transporter permease n=1 Tax=unclassified Achromobacter TaxID=2626865 RepID=UPI0008C27B17|nr:MULTISPECIES: ABC transporter permease [unclassified Achromobacter]SEI43242.1 capsular polysaccharide transport system permease protein [Achromobacter sp. NFACC18-2]SIT31370.1 capsular polysaccharide transport system permease protein [Achromobacter sp. MFA1 R4]
MRTSNERIGAAEITRRTPAGIVRAVIFALVLREMRGRFGTHRYGAFWLIFEPLAHIVALMAIYALLRGRANSGLDLSVFLVSGIIPFILFKNIALKGMEAVNANKGLFAYRQIKPIDTIVARVVVECALMACVYGMILFGLGLWGGSDVSIYRPIQWGLVLFVGTILSFGLGLIFCIVAEALPESKTFIRLSYMPLYFLSGIIIPLWLIPEKFQHFMLWNPYLHLIDSLRANVFQHYPQVAGISMWYASFVALSTLFVGLALYRVRRLNLVAV